jgi:hypothetical protein
MIKMKWRFPTSNHKFLNLTMLIHYKKNLSQHDLMDCKIITIEEEKKSFFGRLIWLLSMFWDSIEIRWNGLEFAQV